MRQGVGLGLTSVISVSSCKKIPATNRNHTHVAAFPVLGVAAGCAEGKRGPFVNFHFHVPDAPT
jgi:hypothetical protein